MSSNEREEWFRNWLNVHARKGGTDVPARLVTVMALLERLRERPLLSVADHCASSGQQLQDHNRYVASSLARFDVESPVSAFGRRASNLLSWLEPLLKSLEAHGFVSMTPAEREEFLSMIGKVAAERLQVINQAKPLIAR